MCKGLWFAMVVSLLALSSFAEEPGTRQLSVFASNLGYVGGSGSGSHSIGGPGLALSYWWNKNVTLDFSVAREQYNVTRPVYNSELGIVGYVGGLQHTTPFDLEGRYHFTTEGRWRPYIGLGAHYVHTQRSPVVNSRWGAEGTAGVFFSISPRLQINLGVRQLLRGNWGASWDPALKPVMGLSLRF